MVTRKPVSSGGNGQPAPSANPPPVPNANPPPVPHAVIVTAATPTTPSSSFGDPMAAPLATLQEKTDKVDKGKAPAVEPPSDSESENEWDSEEEWELADKEEQPAKAELPKPRSPAGFPQRPPAATPSSSNEKVNAANMPAILRVGPPGGIPQPSVRIPHQSKESLVSAVSNSSSNNPWRTASQTPPRDRDRPPLRPQNTGELLFGAKQNASAVWANSPSGPAGFIAELPSVSSPRKELEKLNMNELPAITAPAKPITPDGEAPADWMEKEKARLDALNAQQPIIAPAQDPYGEIPIGGFESTPAWQNQQAVVAGEQKEIAVEDAPPKPVAPQSAPAPQLAPAPALDLHTPDAIPPAQRLSDADKEPVVQTKKPSLLEIDTTVNEAHPRRVDSPGTSMKKQQNKTYQIKIIRWFDERSRKIRVSPILVQNANGPCPLLALVNALTLSTPENVDSGLVEVLKSREQVSLGLLLDAVFEELMSGRRGEAVQELPDVGDLYSFLIALHTGMNVNPRFIADPDQPQQGKSGGFEQTREMRFYSTFSVPLLHGWIPEPGSEAFSAFERSAKTYEDAQNIQFYEEELEAKLGGDGLSQEEQNLFEDLISIKQFFSEWPTQLTEYGLQTIRDHFKPGEIAILFRNDHFSTVYKEPKSNSLLTLVTDAGYASHDEIVWESLVDINGMRTEHFSGDFRPVSHNVQEQRRPSESPQRSATKGSLSSRPVQSMLDVDQGWTQVGGKKGKRGKKPSTQESGVVGSSSSSGQHRAPESGLSQAEQEDADLALALQLQEEEEDRQRREEADRRNRQLSASVIEQQASQPQPRPLVPPRRTTGQPTFTTNRPAGTEGDAPPPSYEDASKDRRFVPPRGHPASPHSPMQRQQSAYMSTSSGMPASAGRRPSTMGTGRPPLADSGRLPGRRTSGVAGGYGGPMSREEKCIIM